MKSQKVCCLGGWIRERKNPANYSCSLISEPFSERSWVLGIRRLLLFLSLALFSSSSKRYKFFVTLLSLFFSQRSFQRLFYFFYFYKSWQTLGDVAKIHPHQLPCYYCSGTNYHQFSLQYTKQPIKQFLHWSPAYIVCLKQMQLHFISYLENIILKWFRILIIYKSAGFNIEPKNSEHLHYELFR